MTVLLAVVLAAGWIALWLIWRFFFRDVDMAGERGPSAAPPPGDDTAPPPV